MELIINITLLIANVLFIAVGIVLLYAESKRAYYSDEFVKKHKRVMQDIEDVGSRSIDTIETYTKDLEETVRFLLKSMNMEYRSFLKKTETHSGIVELEKIKSQAQKKYTPIETLDMTARSTNALVKNGIGSVEELVTYTRGQLLLKTGIGLIAIEDIEHALAAKNLSLSPEKYE